ncbi:hypothetical protein SAMN05444285_1452 [Draconibacterium orientale]|uniref:Uncharacterized protein n=1 Tax=Draconibacterium orientale TaxID=1168034 RepID=A0A1I0JJN4_9BACT|nr:hypothetical protein SAMN05444285_1452 [Draconibacterium orientale]
MAYLKEAQKRDFINQMAIITQESFDLRPCLMAFQPKLIL